MARVDVCRDVVDRLTDARGRRVEVLSHCLLNENIRFPGGATRAGVVREAVDPYVRDGVGIVQHSATPVASGVTSPVSLLSRLELRRRVRPRHLLREGVRVACGVIATAVATATGLARLPQYL